MGLSSGHGARGIRGKIKLTGSNHIVMSENHASHKKICGNASAALNIWTIAIVYVRQWNGV